MHYHRRIGLLRRIGPIGLLFALFASPAHAAIDAPTVQRSIDRGVEFLRKTQQGGGGWVEYSSQSCGLSALCTLAMLNAGVDHDDPAMIAALRYLRMITPRETYSVSLQTLVFCELGADQDAAKIRRNVKYLEQLQKPDGGNNAGAWDYGNGSGNGDPSNTQFAVLALGAAADRGFAVDREVLQRSSDYWIDRQLAGGGWSYGRSGGASGSMTCAGIASLIIARDAAGPIDGPAAGLDCCGQSTSGDSLQRGLKFLADRFTLQGNPGGEAFSYFYYLYAVERVGRLTGRRIIGDRDWYREGAERLVSVQDPFRGFWKGSGPIETNPDIATSFALLFLAKGKRQVVLGQWTDAALGEDPDLQVDAAGLSGLVGQVQRDWRRDLTWQVVQSPAASVADMLAAPVLLIAGNQNFMLDDPTIQRLAAYVDAGGTLLFENRGGEGCGDAGGFERGVRTFCEAAYPAATLDPLPPSHPIWFAQRPVDPDAIDAARWPQGLAACCRTAVFYSPVSLTCRWRRADQLAAGQTIAPAIKKDVTALIFIGENLIAYATGRQLRDKLDAVVQIGGTIAPPPTRSSVPRWRSPRSGLARRSCPGSRPGRPD